MNRYQFLAGLCEVAMVAMAGRATLKGRDFNALREAFAWDTLVREALLGSDALLKFRTQAIWQQRIIALINEAEAKVPAVILAQARKPGEVNGHGPAEAMHGGQ